MTSDEPKVTKQFILEHLEDNEIDLSLCNLTKVPVKELVRKFIIFYSNFKISFLIGTGSTRHKTRSVTKSLSFFASKLMCVCVCVCV